MDNSQLVTIAVTAIITAFAREIAGALSSVFKNTATNTTIREKIKAALTVNKIVATINLLLALYSGWQVYKYASSSAPVDRFAVFNIAYFTGLAVLSLARICMILMIHTNGLLQSSALPAQIRQEIAKVKQEQKDAAEVKAYNDAVEQLKETLERSKKYLAGPDVSLLRVESSGVSTALSQAIKRRNNVPHDQE